MEEIKEIGEEFEAFINGLMERFRPFEVGDDPANHRQVDTIRRIQEAWWNR